MGVYNLEEVHARPLKFYEPATFLENIWVANPHARTFRGEKPHSRLSEQSGHPGYCPRQKPMKRQRSPERSRQRPPTPGPRTWRRVCARGRRALATVNPRRRNHGGGLTGARSARGGTCPPMGARREAFPRPCSRFTPLTRASLPAH